MKILFVIDTLKYGGAAKKTSIIANELYRRGHQVYIVTDTNNSSGFTIEEGIQLLSICNHHSRIRVARIIRKLKRIRNIVNDIVPNVVVSVLPHISFLVKLSLLGMNIPIIFSDETSFARKDSWYNYIIRHFFYNFADAVVILTQNDYNLLGKNIPQKVVIHNPVIFPSFNYDFSNKENVILAIGPLYEWEIKGFDLLFEAFRPLSTSFPDWKIAIAGFADNRSYSVINNMIKENNIEGRVELLGFRNDIFTLMQKSSIYALSSRIEGFSLSLVEALSQGCACVAFENHGVIKEVTCGGKGVYLVKDGDVNEFSHQLKILMESSEERIHMAREGESVISIYSQESIVSEWEDLFLKVCKKGK